MALYVLGSVAGGGALGAALGGTGTLFVGPLRPGPAVLSLLVVALCALAAAVDLRLLRGGLPTVGRQVNEDWLDRYRGWVIGLGYGFQLGLGVVTIVTTATVYLTFALALVAGSWTGGLAVGGAFGLARALPLLAMRRASTPERLLRAHRRLQAWARPARLAVPALLSVVAVGVAGLGGLL